MPLTPETAIRQMVQTLSRAIALVSGLYATVKSHGLNLERHWELPRWNAIVSEGISGKQCNA